MKTFSLCILFVFATLTCVCQNQEKPLWNFDFERIEKAQPQGWFIAGNANYKSTVDSIQAKSGKYAVSLSFEKGLPSFRSWGFIIPGSYRGKKITLSGYIKTENVTDGYAGLWMRIDPNVAFDNMHKNGVKGTTNWQQYTITLDMDSEITKQVVIGGILMGKGKMWLDNMHVSIDGKDINDLEPVILPADKDHAFDQASQINTIQPGKKGVENLKTLGLIWGFLKYYHPNIAKGDYNWDYELFRVLPKVLQTDATNRDRELVEWIKGLGQFTEGKKTNQFSSVKMAPDLDWIKNMGLSAELSMLLSTIEKAAMPEQHYYIRLQPGAGNPGFKNEQAYAKQTYPDAGFRLLALYRYWNIIQYYFPYKNLLEEDWKNVLEAFIPKVLNASDANEYTLTMLELTGRIHDTHAFMGSSVLNNYRGLRYAPLKLCFVEDKAVVTAYYDEQLGKATGLKTGDVLTAVNGKSIKDIVEERLKYYAASNYSTQLRNIATDLLRTNDSSIRVTFMRDKLEKDTVIETFSTKEMNIYNIKQDTCFKLMDGDIAYIHNGFLKRAYLPEIWKTLKNTKGLIIDIRNYPSDFPIFELSNYLMPKPTPFVQFTNGSIAHPGLFTIGKTLSVGKKNGDYYKGKVVILVNEFSQSSAEYHAMAYRVHPNATVIGSTTAGADGNVSYFDLPGGIRTAISGIGVYYPDGKETQRIGIIPDSICKPTIKGIREGRDELVEKAIEIIRAP
ncbi:S41 family peptidase [Olivibacter ginsenosidimutans]|uniref:S41 family peptidase n=1 Tax=Olivibacter ginsenosidimutans TaxID=1176537 RepID=A0ABP9AWI5_9SPHI